MSTHSLLSSVGEHEKKLRRYFDTFDIPADRKPFKCRVVILVFVNRSGSSLVGEYLRATGRFSGFGEPLNHDVVIARCEEEGIRTFEGYLTWLIGNVHRRGTQFGLKASVDQVLMLMRSGAIPRCLSPVRWVFVQRVDLLSQAISYSIAEQTGRWHSYLRSNKREPVYDFKDIRKRLTNISDAYSAGLTLLNYCGIQPYFLTYEQFEQDPEAETARIASFVGVPGPIEIDRQRLSLERQRNEINARFRKRFLEDVLNESGFFAERRRRQAE